MIRKNQTFLNRLNILLDILLVILAYIISSWLRFDVLNGHSGNMAVLSGQTVLLSCIYAFVLSFVLLTVGFYGTTRIRPLSWKLKVIFLTVTGSILVVSFLLFLFRLEDFSRGVLFIFYGAVLLFLGGKYTVMRLLFNRLRAQGYNLQHVVVIGTGELAGQYAEDVKKERNLGYHVAGFIGRDPAREPYLGDYEALDEQLRSPDIYEAVIALEIEDYPKIREIIGICEKNGVKYSVIPFYNDIMPANPVVETIGNSKLISMRNNRLENIGWHFLKRGFDFCASLIGLVVLSPLLLILALGVKLSSPGPVFFKQKRVGYNRKTVYMLKFRSMKVNKDQDTAWSKDKDDRRTPFGSFIRKTSLDELPQLINVLKGDMSLVGPRPELPFFVEQFKETIPFYMVKHQVKPGMTGWAQVNGYRGDTSIEKRVELDLWYIDHWSPGLDLKILFKTVFGGSINSETIEKKK